MRRLIGLVATLCISGVNVAYGKCGESFPIFIQGLKIEAIQAGYDPAIAEAFFSGIRRNAIVIRADRSQRIFQKPFVEFTNRIISTSLIRRGLEKSEVHNEVLEKIQTTYGVSRGVLLSLWALESSYGKIQGDFNTADALVTLAHDCRRPGLFRPQIFAALELYRQGRFDPTSTTGAWAGEIGMVQMLPTDILKHGMDGDGDGIVRPKNSVSDALMSAAKLLSSLGWQPDQPWLQEINVPEAFDWSLSGAYKSRSVKEWINLGITARIGTLQNSPALASIILPQGHRGPKFLAYSNFRVFFQWNNSFIYSMTAAYLANRLEGAPAFSRTPPDAGLNEHQMKLLQSKLQALGHDVGKIDGILGQRTRAAVQFEQARLKLVADAWPTPELLLKIQNNDR